MDAPPIVRQGPLFIAVGAASHRGACDCCTDHVGLEDYAVYLFRFGETVVAMCGSCLRRLKNQLRRAEG
jgi:hypothetical protein